MTFIVANNAFKHTDTHTPTHNKNTDNKDLRPHKIWMSSATKKTMNVISINNKYLDAIL